MNIKSLGIVLVIIGTIMLVVTGFNIITAKEVLLVGPISINQNSSRSVQWPVIAGVIIMAVGLVMIFLRRKKPA